MNKTLIMVVLFFVAIIIIISGIVIYRCQGIKQNEPFVDAYYHWNWNDPRMITRMNLTSIDNDCKNCTYSMSCDYTDDAQPFCHKSYDVPVKSYDVPVKSYDVSQFILRHNSY
jgi:hypothetical protein